MAKTRVTEVRRKRKIKIAKPQPTVDHIVTETDVISEPEVEIRRPATLSQALTERAEVVVKPKKRIVTRVVERTRKAA
jgi:hypothetical protein